MAEDKLTSSPHGILRIFLRSGDQVKGKGLKKLFPQSTSAAILQAARDYGLLHGVIKHCVSGFFRDKEIHTYSVEGLNTGVPVYVELHGTREALEGFCKSKKELLQGRTLVYKEVEHWHWQPTDEAELDAFLSASE